MAEESIDLLVTPEKIGLDTRNISKSPAGNPDSLSNGRSTLARHRRASIGSYHAGDRSLRNSAEKSDSVDSSQTVVPHYLRASTGSCHDFCKYGREHSFEKKERKPFRKRIARPLPNELYSVQILVSDGQKKEKVVNHGPPTDTKNHLLDQKPSPDTKFYSSKPKISLDNDKAMKHNDRKPSPDTRSYSPKPKTSLDNDKAMKYKPSKYTRNHSSDMPSTHAKSYFRKPKMPSDAETDSPKENASSGNKILLPKRKPSSTKKFPSADPPEIVKSVIFPSTEVEDSVKQVTSTHKKMSKAERTTTYVSQQHSSPVKSKHVKVKPSSSSVNSGGICGKGRRNIDAVIGKNLTVSKAPAKKVLVAPAAIMSPKLSMKKTARTNSGKAGNLKLVSPLKDQNRIQRVKTEESNDEKVSEKTLHVIGMESENNVSKSIPGDDAISSLPSPSSAKSLSSAKSSSLSSHEEENAETECSGGEADEVISDNNESQEIVKVPPVKGNHNKTLRKTRVVVPEDKCRSPVKLKFRSGKVVDLQSDNNSPRRLRFRRARVLVAEDSKSDLRRRTLKKAGVNDDTKGAEVSSEKVVLKHQDVQGKKDAQGLFNNVIEETASKLVESRKSKVKALVGAFETVISLQECKPSSQVVS